MYLVNTTDGKVVIPTNEFDSFLKGHRTEINIRVYGKPEVTFIKVVPHKIIEFIYLSDGFSFIKSNKDTIWDLLKTKHMKTTKDFRKLIIGR